jgi:hypothetical protein
MLPPPLPRGHHNTVPRLNCGNGNNISNRTAAPRRGIQYRYSPVSAPLMGKSKASSWPPRCRSRPEQTPATLRRWHSQIQSKSPGDPVPTSQRACRRMPFSLIAATYARLRRRRSPSRRMCPAIIPKNRSSASSCRFRRRSYRFQCIPLGFSGKSSRNPGEPPSRSRIFCALIW